MTTAALILGIVASSLQCPVCDDAERLVQGGDTAQAIVVLREAVSERKAARQELDPAVAGRLGELLVHTVESRAIEFEGRAEAQEMLRAAVDKDQDNPRWWYALGLLERMRGLQLDAARYLDRALELAEARPETLTDYERARLHAEKGRALEEHVLNFQGFIAQANEIPVVQGTGEGCGVAFCLNFERPDWFHETLFSFEPQDQLVDEEREAMHEEFATAFALDPSHRLAARGRLGALARAGEWDTFLAVALGHAQALPDDPWARVFVAAGLHRNGQQAAAGSALEEALEVMEEDDRELLTGLSTIVRRRDQDALEEADSERRRVAEDFTWTRLDPFYLTEANERRLEHVTRVALAELWFGDPRIHERGALTDPGRIFIRYGGPEWIRQIRITDAAAGAIQNVTGGKPSGGRWIFWTYSKTLPSFVFEKQLGGRRIQHASHTSSREVEEYMRDRQPSSYQPRNFHALEHQLALFKGTQAEVEADVVVGLPEVERPERVAGDSEDEEIDVLLAETGVFIVPGGPGQEPIGLRATVDLADPGTRSALFRLPLNRGRYAYSVEVLAEDWSITGSARAVLEAEEFGVDRDLYLSDLLLVDSIRPAGDDPRERRHFRMKASPDLRYQVGQPVGVYFEIYGLGEDDDLSRYDVQVRVVGEEGDGVLGGIARRVSGVLGRSGEDDNGVLSWSGTADGSWERVPEWFTLSLPELEPGEYTVEVEVRDTVEGREATASRIISLVEGG